jgi:hypothetical protein
VVAVLGMAVTAAWAAALIVFMKRGTVMSGVVMVFFAALAVDVRPDLIVLVLLSFAILPRRAWLPSLIPLVAVFGAMAAYNYAMPDVGVCSLCSPSEFARFLNSASHYLFWAPAFSSQFPFVALQPSRLDPAVSYPRPSEPVGGVFALPPLALIGTFCAVLLAMKWRTLEPVARAGVVILAAGWLILLSLSTCWWVVSRYELDFYGLMLVGTVICIEQSKLPNFRALCAILALYSIVIGALLGFR